MGTALDRGVHTAPQPLASSVPPLSVADCGAGGTFGGDPGLILPSPTGDGRRKHPGHPEPEGEERLRFTGKIAGLIFDGFGDFEGFLLDTEDGERKFYSREKEIEELAERVWRESSRITVVAERHEPHRPLSIIIRQPPAPFLALTRLWYRRAPFFEIWQLRKAERGMQ